MTPHPVLMSFSDERCKMTMADHGRALEESDRGLLKAFSWMNRESARNLFFRIVGTPTFQMNRKYVPFFTYQQLGEGRSEVPTTVTYGEYYMLGCEDVWSEGQARRLRTLHRVKRSR
jgi:hypothetical protein